MSEVGRGIMRGYEKATESDVAECEVFIYALGYESRSSHILTTFTARSQRLIGIGFGSRKGLAFAENHLVAQRRGSELYEIQDEDFSTWCADLGALLGGAKSVALDVSSFSRDRLGRLLQSLMQWRDSVLEREFVVCYAPASYESVSELSRDHGFLLGSAELLRGFEGDYIDPAQPLTAIIGLGYEPGRAVGSIELIEAPLVTAFLPHGVDERYDRAVVQANAGLLGRPTRVSVAPYNVLAPWDLFDELYRLVWGLSLQGRSTLVPLGPKIFCAVACLVSWEVNPSPPIWRVSAGGEDLPVDSHAAGPICGLVVRSRRVDS